MTTPIKMPGLNTQDNTHTILSPNGSLECFLEGFLECFLDSWKGCNVLDFVASFEGADMVVRRAKYDRGVSTERRAAVRELCTPDNTAVFGLVHRLNIILLPVVLHRLLYYSSPDTDRHTGAPIKRVPRRPVASDTARCPRLLSAIYRRMRRPRREGACWWGRTVLAS